MEVGERIRKIRKLRKLTQADVARKAQIAINSLRLYESGKRTPNIDQLQAIAKAMDSSLFELLDERDQEIFDSGLSEGQHIGIIWGEHGLEEDLKYRGYSFSEIERDLIWAFDDLNADGQRKAIERVRELTEIPRYQKEPSDPPQSTLDSTEGTDTTTPQDAPETPPEGPTEQKMG